MVINKDEFLEAVRNAQNFDDLTKILKHYQGFADTNAFRLILTKCMQFAGHGFVVSSEFPVWQRLFAIVAGDDGVNFIFTTGLMLEFRKERGGKARMHISMTGGVREW
jgi:hypothetical protein